MVLKEVIFNSFYFWCRCGGLERRDFVTVSIREGVVVFKEEFFNSF